MGAYDRINYNGVTLNRRTAAMLDEVSEKLGYDLTLYQGSYNHGVGASSGTHDGGGAVDLAPGDWQRKVRALREVGFAAWHRLPSQGPWVEHIHAIALGDRDLAPLAAQQAAGYKDRRNGLGPWPFGPDDTWHPSPIREFDYAAWLRGKHRSKWDSGDVYMSKLHAGVTDSDSVRRLQTTLKRLKHFKTWYVPVNGKFGPRTQMAVRRWQRRYFPHSETSGRKFTREQVRRLFNDNYTLHF